MFALYLKILALNIGVSNFVVLMVAMAKGDALRFTDFAFPAAIQFLLVSMIFIVLDLLRPPGQTETGFTQTRAEPAASRPELRSFRSLRFVAVGLAAAKQNSAKG